MSKLWEAIKDLERERGGGVPDADDSPHEVSPAEEQRVAYLDGIRWKWRRHGATDDQS
jgi:hypothetical protein